MATTKSVAVSAPMNQLDDARHANETKETGESKKSLPARNKTQTAKETQARDLKKLCADA